MLLCDKVLEIIVFISYSENILKVGWQNKYSLFFMFNLLSLKTKFYAIYLK